MAVRIARLVAATAILCGTRCVSASAGDMLIVRGGSAWQYVAMKKLAGGLMWKESQGELAAWIDVKPWNDKRNIERLCEGDCDLLYHRAFPSPEEADLLRKRFSSQPPGVVTAPVAYAQVAVITHPSNPVRQLTLDKMCELLRVSGVGLQWSVPGGTGGVVACYGEGRDSASRLVIRHACMMLGPDRPTGYHLYREDFKMCADAAEVIKYVKADRDGIGFILHRGQPLPGVKVLAVARTDSDKAVGLQAGRFSDKDYPLSEPMVLYLPPGAPEDARKLYEFATGPEGAKILNDYGVWPEYELKKIRAEKKLKEEQHKE